MCGIAGIVSSSDPKGGIVASIEAMHHRGPDDHGIYTGEGVAIGMARLAILDLSHLGHQPMQSHCKRYWIVYNGECYNHQSIRKTLEAEGVQFVSNSDTEVVLEAYAKWGSKCLNVMNGMFAFAIWDAYDRTLFAARDRLGIKPFYYAATGGSFVFASELKAILNSGKIPFEVNPLASYQYFLFGHVVQPQTILKDVLALMPGHYLKWDKDGVHIQEYWSLRYTQESLLQEYEAKEMLLEHLDRSVRLQMISDRPVGLFLSGGLDSATLLAYMSKLDGGINSFSLGFDDVTDARSEDKEAIELAAFFGSRHQQVYLSGKEVAEDIERFFDHLDQPSVDGLNTYLVSKYAVRSMTVALSGLGGDELFGGYTRQSLLWWKYHNISPWVERVLNPIIPDVIDTDLALRLKSWGCGSDILYNYTLSRAGGRPGSHANPIAVQLMDSRDRSHWFFDAFRHLLLPETCGPLNQIMGLDLHGFMGCQLLRDMDAVSMSHSLEVRFPLIDHELVEFAFRLPGSLRMEVPKNRPSTEGRQDYAASRSKRLLLEAMLPLLPPNFEKRRKNGFRLPIGSWLRNELKEFALDLLTDSIKKQDIVRGSVIENHITQLRHGLQNHWETWKIIAFLGTLRGLRKAKGKG